MPRELSARIYSNTPARFAIAFFSAALALLVARGLNPAVSVPVAYLTALAAIAFTSRYCGAWPSVASAALSLFGIDFWFLAPAHSLRITHMSDWLNICVFLLVATVVVAMGEADRRQRIRLQNAAGELEEKVQDRTAELDRTNQSLRELTGRLMNLQDEERRRIARELHDNAGQALAALAMNLDTVANDLQRLMKTANTVTDSAGIVQQMTGDIRTMSYLLHPPLLDDAGLVPALQWFIHGFSERSKIAVELKCDENLGGFSKEIEIATFRLVQECLTNIHRHSGSATASIRITHHDGQLSVDVRDLCKGISSETRQQLESGGAPGVGIRGMRERVRQLGGKLEVSSEGIGMGTRIVARLPVTEVIPIQQLG